MCCVVRSWRKSGASADIWSSSGWRGTTSVVFSEMPIEKGLPGTSVLGTLQLYSIFQVAPSQQWFQLAWPPVSIVTSLPYGLSATREPVRTKLPAAPVGFAVVVVAGLV